MSRGARYAPLVVLTALAGCTSSDSGAPDSAADSASEAPDYPENPVLVYVVLDTISSVAARDADLCGAVGGLAAGYDLDSACLDGAVPPSSWTGESHLRDLFPEHLEGERRAAQDPDCDAQSVFGTIAAARDATYVVGVQNGVLGAPSAPTCDDGQSSWFQGADVVHRGTGGPEDTAMVDGITDLVAAAAAGGPVVGLLNTIAGGTHTPRCEDASTEACQALYAIAVEYGTVAETDLDGQTAFWADPLQYFRFFTDIERLHDQARTAPLVAATIAEHLDRHLNPYVIDRLDPLLRGLEEAGRLDDLTLVVLSDHGENPCYADPTTGEVNCAHTGAPSEWTANVPVIVIPAARAETWAAAGLTGDATTPWSTVALAWGLLDAAATPAPPTWPERLAPGLVTSWSCRTQSRHDSGPHVFGIRVSSSGSARCTGGNCGAWTWTTAPVVGEDPTPLAAVPSELADFVATPDWTTVACQ